MAKVAIVGTGISGLSSAYLLYRTHDIAVYEKSPEIGGHTRTRAVRYGDREIPVDTGFIVFNHQNYPNLLALFRHLSVPTQESDMTFGLTVNGGELEWGADTLNSLFGQRRNLANPQFWQLIRDILRFNRLALKTAEANPELTLGSLIEKLGMGEWFAKYYILPIGGAIWSCSLSTMLKFPALSFVRFFKEHGLLAISGQPQWHTVTGGSREYLKRLTNSFKDRILTEREVTSVTRKNGKVQVTDSSGETKEYDRIVLGSHADQSLKLLADPTPDEKEVLGAFRYQPNLAVLHKDESLMPKRRRCWSSWIYHADSGPERDTISVTYWMNRLQNIDRRYPLFVTLNPYRPIAPEHIFDQHVFEHPVYSTQVVEAHAKLPLLQGRLNTWFCGAWCRNGFHEDGIASAVAVARAMGAVVPW